ncbi:putative RDD family membrane protein YckC [Chryseobacterium defluvii]|uniref:Putative RDD family membrane protein YckC n=1 Tax=Chryseobacterium defluvii TaxID=160396 RepID=A0A840KE10_9FLAO|nr:RDD family protein [Chryseobacterium defluvii]MBB4805994.1 putative RDD family membrane protein YckC [Chryseobacterium defluvii]
MKKTPLRIEGINDNIYAGFGTRLASLLLDAIILSPLIFIILFINSFSLDMFFYTIVPNLLFNLWYNIYLPKQYGGTPGKLIMGMQILKLNGQYITFKEAFLRHLLTLMLTAFSVTLMINSILKADEVTFENLSWIKQSQYLMSLSPVLFTIYSWVSNAWTWSELIVLLTNPRKRALHDYVAGTVIVKKDYVERIQQEMASENLL